MCDRDMDVWLRGVQPVGKVSCQTLRIRHPIHMQVRFTCCISAKDPATSKCCPWHPAGSARLRLLASAIWYSRSLLALWSSCADETALRERSWNRFRAYRLVSEAVLPQPTRLFRANRYPLRREKPWRWHPASAGRESSRALRECQAAAACRISPIRSAPAPDLSGLFCVDAIRARRKKPTARRS